APVVPMAPVVIASVPPPPVKAVEAPPAPVAEVEIPITEAAPAPAVEQPIPIAEAAPVALPVAIVEGARAPVVEAVPSAESAPAPAVEMPVSIVEGARGPHTSAAVPVAQATPVPSFELTFESASMPAASSNQASAERGSRPRIAVEGRRRAGEDLIGELFEIMHELAFARDVAEGSQFVLSVLNELLPCEGVLIHVFDINTGHFVVVRAKGPHANTVILQRMSDQDPLVRSVMRSTHAVSLKNAADDARFNGPRWQALGVAPRAVLCGGVQLSGRYLGLIEVANPLGDVPFHQSELNALDYICEQFAAFLSKKPIVLSADVVLSRV
ncbi:MAG TPA: GAF domain-containing protein, partial [Polyangiaceae bacterium]